MLLLSKRGRRSRTEGLRSAIRTGRGRGDAEGGLLTPSLIRNPPKDGPHHTPVQLLFQAICLAKWSHWALATGPSLKEPQIVGELSKKCHQVLSQRRGPLYEGEIRKTAV